MILTNTLVDSEKLLIKWQPARLITGIAGTVAKRTAVTAATAGSAELIKMAHRRTIVTEEALYLT